MKDIIVGRIIGAVLLSGWIYLATYLNLGGGTGGVVGLGFVKAPTQSTTSTESFCEACPVELLTGDSGRRFARIDNVSANDVYIFLSDVKLTVDGLPGDNVATTTITELDGFLLESKEFIVFDADFPFKGFVYASTSSGVSALNIAVK